MSGRGAPLRIGFTYDLRADYLALGYSEEETAELDSAVTIDAVSGALAALGHEVDRVGSAFALVERLARGDRWDLVFNFCEGLRGRGREAAVPALLELYDIPATFSDPLVLCVALDKAVTKRLVRDAGVPTPAFALVERLSQVDTVDLPFPLFAKPVAEGTSKGVDTRSVLKDRDALRQTVAYLLDRFQQPVLVEELLPGREVTVGIWGTGARAEAIGTLDVELRPEAEQGVYSYENKERCEELVTYRAVFAKDDPFVREAEAVSLAAWRALGCRDAGRVDIRADARGRASFIEVNPLAGLNPGHSDLPILCGMLGIPYEALIERIVEEARPRVEEARARRRP